MPKRNKSKNTNATKPGNAQNVMIEKSNEEVKSFTFDDVEASISQAEFDAKKSQLIQQLLEDISGWEDSKKVAEAAAQKAQDSLEQLEKKVKELSDQRDELQEKLDAIQKKYSEAEQTVKSAMNKAESIRLSADTYAEDVKRAADEECLKKLNEAANEARKAWQTKIDDLSRQIQEIAEQEAALHEAQRQLDKEKRFVEDEKEALDELKEDLQARKSRYEAANPMKIARLETELADERSKYAVLQERYRDLQKRLEDLQVLMDIVKTEINDPEKGTRIASMNEIVSSLQKLKEEYNRLASVYERYPNDAAIFALEEKARRADGLERANEALELERNRYREEVIAARNATKELEIVKQEVEATNALNEHLLQELESHKTALESRTGDTCPSLSKVDMEIEADDFKADIMKRMQRSELLRLSDIVSHVKNFAGSRSKEEQLYYTDNDIRAFLSGMAVSRLIILQGMSGTGKSSLPRIFSEAISGFNRLIPVESSWRDRNELLGYYNDFNKKFNAKSFTIELYRSSKERCQPIPTFIVLDEMNLARIEYYFSDFLAILQEPNHEKWLIELVSSDMRTLPMELPDSVKAKMQREAPTIFAIWEKIERSRQGDIKAETSDEDKELLTAYLSKLGQLTGAKDLIDGRKIKVTDNIWFVGTANRDESTFEITDKVYDRAQVVSLNRKGVSAGNYTPVSAKFISAEKLQALFQDAINNNKHIEEVKNRLEALDRVLMEKFNLSFGNRIVTQTIKFVGVYTAANGQVNDALDYQISTKILRKVINSDDDKALYDLLDAVKDYPETTRLLEKRLSELM
ncbi:hypothetical protein [Selenomonas sp. AB3002]|uniref:hypothetical protein n=1 Tax=Selenomonas sp. AB3002 TaxID=1392502 RepID=UPI000497B65C